MKRVTRPFPDLWTWRHDQRINQVEAARILGLSQTHYSRLERRERFMPGKQAKKIMEKTGVPLEVLVGAA